jgi:MAD (mothers against decapentaplegic) interacting protein
LGSYSSNIITYTTNDPDSDHTNISKTTGAAFVVFNGALKTNLTLNAKLTTVEDGIMIQIDSETMTKLKQSLQSMKPFRIECNKAVTQSNNLLTTSLNSSSNDNVISIEWTKDDRHLNKGVYSIIDGRPLIGIKSLRLTNTYDYANETKSIRWTEIYLIKIEDDLNGVHENNFNINKFADHISEACCTALAPILDDLVIIQKNYLIKKKKLDKDKKYSKKIDDTPDLLSQPSIIKSINPFRLGLRVDMNKDQVGYLIGMNGNQIFDEKISSRLDNELIQILHQASSASSNLNVSLEFIFYVQERFNCAK